MAGCPTPMSLQLFSRATIDMPEVLLRTRAKAATGGERNGDEKGIALIVLNKSEDSGASAPFALTCAEDAQDRVRASLSKNACAGLCNPPLPGFQAGEE